MERSMRSRHQKLLIDPPEVLQPSGHFSLLSSKSPNLKKSPLMAVNLIKARFLHIFIHSLSVLRSVYRNSSGTAVSFLLHQGPGSALIRKGISFASDTTLRITGSIISVGTLSVSCSIL